MSAEVIRTIRQAEQQAENIRQEAMLKAREIVNRAEEQGNVILKNGAQDAEKEGKEIIEREQAEAEREIEILRQESGKKCEALTLQAEAMKDRASSLIMERIVKSYGNN